MLSRDGAEHHGCVGVTSVPWGAPELGDKEPGHQNLPCPGCQPAGRSPGGVSRGWGEQRGWQELQGRGLPGSSSRAELTPLVCSVWEVFP